VLWRLHCVHAYVSKVLMVRCYKSGTPILDCPSFALVLTLATNVKVSSQNFFRRPKIVSLTAIA
jgi:hypothetical protein